MILLSWFLIHCIIITIDGLKDEKKTADIAVIMGSKVNEDGTLSERLTKRMECGLNLYRSGRVKHIIVSGGLGKEGHYEGKKMHHYLIEKGVPDSVIIIDNNGNNTELTVKNTLGFRTTPHFNSIIVVSQYFHLTRSKMLFKKHGFENVSSVSADYYEIRDIYSFIREFVGFYKQLLF